MCGGNASEVKLGRCGQCGCLSLGSVRSHPGDAPLRTGRSFSGPPLNRYRLADIGEQGVEFQLPPRRDLPKMLTKEKAAQFWDTAQF